MTSATPTPPAPARPQLAAAFLLGVGMGGFVDGILFHQILQIHNMISARKPPTTLENLEQAMVFDGLFHVLTWTTTAIGLAMLHRAGRLALQGRSVWSGRILLGGMLIGWGAFNLIEGLIDHHILHVHHVHERAGGVSLYDWLFLASGPALAAIGWLIARADLSAARAA